MEHWQKFSELVQLTTLSFVQYYKVFMVFSMEDKPLIKEYSHYTSLFPPLLIKDHFILLLESQNTVIIYQTRASHQILRAACLYVYFCCLAQRPVASQLESRLEKINASLHLLSSSFSW